MYGERSGLPEGLAETPPGAELASLMAGVDRTKLNGHHLVTLLQARVRQVSHLQAELYADLMELAGCPPGDEDSPPERTTEIDEFCVEEVAAALHWTRRGADFHLGLAYHLLERLPQVWDALHRGVIDLPRARVILDHTVQLEPEAATRVAQAVLERAGELTTGQLGARLRRLTIRLDPEGARHRYQQSLRERRVMAEANPEGTANLAGYELPAERVAAITERIKRLAQIAKHGDDPRNIDQVRADVFMDLLEGHHLSGGSRRGVVDLHVDMATLAGLAETPGEIEGLGPVIAEVARQMAADQIDGEWRYTVTNPDNGQLVCTGITRRRPTAAQRRLVQARQPVCIFPGCRAPATRSDLDHTIDWGRGGPTHPRNLGPLCRRHHRLKHQGRWKLRQPQPGSYVWTSPHDHSYTVQPQAP